MILSSIRINKLIKEKELFTHKSKHMKKLLSFVVLFAGLGFMASAQDNASVQKKEGKHRGKMVQEHVDKKSPEEMAKIRTERLDKELKFTDAQRKQVYAYNLDQAKKYKEKAEIQQKDREAMRNELKADRERFNSLLTPDQQKILAEKFAKNNEKRMKGKDQRFKGKKDGERPMRKHMETKSTDTESSNG